MRETQVRSLGWEDPLEKDSGLGRSPGEGNGNPLQYCLENPMDGGAWWEPGGSLVGAWWEPGGLQSTGSQRVALD